MVTSSKLDIIIVWKKKSQKKRKKQPSYGMTPLKECLENLLRKVKQFYFLLNEIFVIVMLEYSK